MAGRQVDSMIAIIDYGAGNLQSVRNAFDFLGAECIVSSNREEILSADKVVLPGVGAFGDAMSALSENGLDEVVKEVCKKNIPFLGICMGEQLLFEESEESPGVNGLGIFKGKIVRIPDCGQKIPHMGWNSLELVKNSRILHGIGNEPYVYFVHSYYLETTDSDIVSAYTEYGGRLAVAAERDNIFAVQFHPEKSGETGMKILKNFIEIQ